MINETKYDLTHMKKTNSPDMVASALKALLVTVFLIRIPATHDTK